MKGISLCADCAYYSLKKHKCTRGCNVDPNPSKGDNPSFYLDCPLPEVEEKKKWIPCSERMPESKTGVIFTVDRGHPFICVGYRINSEREGLKLQRWFDKLSGLNFSDYDVKAWMPMPDAYEPPESEVQDDDER